MLSTVQVPPAGLKRLVGLLTDVLQFEVAGLWLREAEKVTLLTAAGYDRTEVVERQYAPDIGVDGIWGDPCSEAAATLTGFFPKGRNLRFGAIVPVIGSENAVLGYLAAGSRFRQPLPESWPAPLSSFAMTAAGMLQDLSEAARYVQPRPRNPAMVTGTDDFATGFPHFLSEQIERNVQEIGLSVLKYSGQSSCINEVLEDVVRRIDGIVTDARSSILLVDSEARLRSGARGVLPDDYLRAIDGVSIDEAAGSFGAAAARCATVIVDDIEKSALWQDFLPMAEVSELRACWSVPVLNARGEVLAIFTIFYRRPKRPSPQDVRFVERIAEFVRIAIERCREREKLRLSEARYRSIFDLVPVAIWEEDISQVIDLVHGVLAAGVDDFGDWLDQNPEFVRRAIEAVKITDVNPHAIDLYRAESREALIARYYRMIDSEEARSYFKRDLMALAEGVNRHEIEYAVVDCEGRPIDVLVRMHRDADDPGRLIITEMDITARKRAEERFRLVAQATSDIVWEYDRRSDRLWIVDGTLSHFGYEKNSESAQGWDYWVARLHPEERETVVASLEAAMSSEDEQWENEHRLLRNDGSYGIVGQRAVFIRDGQGVVERMIGNLVDRTAYKELENQLRQSQRLDAVGRLTGGIAHDFNNLLTVILGNSEMLAEGLPEGSRYRRLADMTAQAAERGAELTNRLLAFSRKQPLAPQSVNVNVVVRGMEGMLRRTLTTSIAVKVVQEPDLWPAMIDVTQLESTLLNLAINARDAMPDGGSLVIETRNLSLTAGMISRNEDASPGDYVLLAVTDTGAGMDDETLARAFEPFFTTKAVGQGSGLGLSMVYGFVKQSRGIVRVQSQPGQGTTISLLLPRAQAADPIENVEEALDDEPASAGRILLVEDDDLVRSHVEAQIDALGYDVVAVENASAALDVLKNDDAFDLMFTDIVMPGGMNGRQLADAVGEIKPGLTVLFSSGYTQNTIESKGRLDDGVHFLQKPFRQQDLARKLKELLRPDADETDHSAI